MDRLQCFCCDHPNPAGARYCNDCGTPLHLKPCRYCEAINDRPAMHCHQCGAEFAFPYSELTPLASGVSADASLGARRAADLRARNAATLGANRIPLSALVAGLVAAVVLSAYYTYRLPRVTAPSVMATALPTVTSTPPRASIQDAERAVMSGGREPAAGRVAENSDPIGVAVSTAVPARTEARSTSPHLRKVAARKDGVKRGAAPPQRYVPATVASVQVAERAMSAPLVRFDAASLVRARWEGGSDRLERDQRVRSPPTRNAALPPLFVGHLCEEGAPASERCDIRYIAKGT